LQLYCSINNPGQCSMNAFGRLRQLIILVSLSVFVASLLCVFWSLLWFCLYLCLYCCVFLCCRRFSVNKDLYILSRWYAGVQDAHFWRNCGLAAGGSFRNPHTSDDDDASSISCVKPALIEHCSNWLKTRQRSVLSDSAPDDSVLPPGESVCVHAALSQLAQDSQRVQRGDWRIGVTWLLITWPPSRQHGAHLAAMTSAVLTSQQQQSWSLDYTDCRRDTLFRWATFSFAADEEWLCLSQKCNDWARHNIT